MKRVLLVLAMALSVSAKEMRPVDYVRPEIDTKMSRWIYFSSAMRPFGLVNLSPDTMLGNDWGAGYLYDEPYIRCFSHLHGWQLYGIKTLPIQTFNRSTNNVSEANKAAFSHADEIIRPGYHKVYLKDRDITAELTSTARVGFHRYTYPGTEGKILLDLATEFGKECRLQSWTMKRISSREFEVSSTMAPTTRRKKPFTVYAVVQLNRDAKTHEEEPGVFVLSFATEKKPVLMKVALSYTGIEGARKNLTAEVADWDFDQVVKASEEEWNTWLSRIEVEGGRPDQRVKFYTDLWHALLGRRIVSDVDGRYFDFFGEQPKVSQVRLDKDGKPLYDFHNFDAYWGSQWSIQNLWGLAYPKVMSDFVNTSLDIYDSGGLIPRGPSGGNYTFVMVGDQAALFISSAYQQGIRDWDVEKAYRGLRKNAFVGGIRDRVGYEVGPNPLGGGMRFYEKTGFVPVHSEGSGWHRQEAGLTVEYNFQDWALAQFADVLGKKEDAAFFANRSHGWTNLYDKTVGWIRPKKQDGTWLEPFSPLSHRGFVEACSAIGTWFTPHDYDRLAELMGGKEIAIARLNEQFEKSRDARFCGEKAWMNYGNQPGTEFAYIFNHLGAPWLAQYWARQVKELTFGGSTPWSGYNDDEDQGHMGSVSAMLALGLFDIHGGSDKVPRYELSAPVFDKITIHLDPRYYKGGQFTIVTKNNSTDNCYIRSAVLNGKKLTRYWFEQSELKNGGELVLELGPKPNKNWGVGD